MVNEVEPDAVPTRGGARRKADYIALTKAARARFDTLAAESIEAVFQAVLTAATQDGDMAAAKLLIDRVIPSRRGAPVSFHGHAFRSMSAGWRIAGWSDVISPCWLGLVRRWRGRFAACAGTRL